MSLLCYLATGLVLALVATGCDLSGGSGSGGSASGDGDGDGDRQLVFRLFAVDAEAADNFGEGVSVDGDRAIVGSMTNAAYVFTRDEAGVWRQEAKLIGDDPARGDRFGRSVAISGNIAVVGAAFDDDNGGGSGAVYVFRREAGGSWSREAKLTAVDGATGDRLGASVAVSGNLVIASASEDFGEAYVFGRDDGGVWSQESKLVGDGLRQDFQNESVAIDGNRAILGATSNARNGREAGAAYVFVRDQTGSWSREAELIASDGASGDGFGRVVAIAGDVAIASARRFGGEDATYVFRRDGDGSWSQEAKLSDGDPDTNSVTSAAVADDLVVLGVRQAANGRGAVYLFRRGTSGTWSQTTTFGVGLATDGDEFGRSVAINHDVVIVGAPGDDNRGNDAGSAHAIALQ